MDTDVIAEVFTPLTDRLTVGRVPSDPTLPDYGDSGRGLLTGVAAARADSAEFQ
ncbi:hypothetical protein [Streptomyces sp. NPDC059371]|uniref:hypothetical protein n=1 Tax=Streptomyces sp. NPDC059371 TaxID=3346812 RepID=UPI0036794271